MGKKYSNKNLLQDINDEFSYISDFFVKRNSNNSYQLVNYIDTALASLISGNNAYDSYECYFDFFNVRIGKWSKLRKAIIAWIRYRDNEQLIMLKML